jgi:regulator of sigma E protease
MDTLPNVSVLSIFYVVLGIGIIIFVHELGHFLVARWAGVRVETFSLGFGPRLFGFRRGHTDYRISLIPLGGYVKMAGEIPIPDPQRLGELRPDELAAQSVGARAAIFSAGVVMNVLFAFVIFPLAFHVGVPFYAPRVGGLDVGLPAWEAGLHSGDKVLTVDGAPVYDFDDILYAATLSRRDHELALEVEREGGGRASVSLPLRDRGARELGFRIRYDKVAVAEDSEGGWRKGDQVLSIDGVPVTQYFDLPNRPDHYRKVRVVTDDPGPDPPREFEVAPISRESGGLMIGVVQHLTPITRLRQGARFRVIREKDRIVRINGKEVRSLQQIQELVWKEPGNTFEFEADRDGQVVRESLEAAGVLERGALLMDFYCAPSLMVCVNPDSPAAQAGLRDGDRVVRVQGEELTRWEELNPRIQKSEGRPLAFEVLRPGDGPNPQPVALSVTPRKVTLLAPALDGAALAVTPLMTVVRFDFPRSIGAGVHYVTRWVVRILEMLKGIFTGQIKPQNLQGIIQIARISYQQAEVGFMKLFYFMAILSLNLAIINLLPIPILDGGWLLFLLIEKIKGSPVSPRTLGISQWVGLIFLLGVFLFVTKNDIIQVFFRGG